MTGAHDILAAQDCLSTARPLVLVDADEVILRFVEGFEHFLRQRDLMLDLTSYRLHGNVRRHSDGEALGDQQVTALLSEFRNDLDSLPLVDGADSALHELARYCSVIVLSNVSAEQGPARRRNLDALGFDFPLVCNSGLKGTAAAALADRSGRPVFFIDDIAQQLVSVGEAVPDAVLIQLVGDIRLKPILPLCEVAHLRAESWEEAARFMLASIGRS
ncbi:MAG: hypothetical protein JOZ55_09180 [Alphaproteobacteria bacterium]|nr:hypothetical protein [Alphaproteobacteria bacterium]